MTLAQMANSAVLFLILGSSILSAQRIAIEGDPVPFPDSSPSARPFTLIGLAISQAKKNHAVAAATAAKSSVATATESPFVDLGDKHALKEVLSRSCDMLIWLHEDPGNAAAEFGSNNVGLGEKAFCWPFGRLKATLTHESVHLPQPSIVAIAVDPSYTRVLSRLWKELEANGLAKAILDAEFPYPIPPYPPSLAKEYVEQMGTLLESARGYAAEASAIASDPIVMNNAGLSEQFSTLAYGLVSLVADIENCLIWKAAVEYLEL